MQQLHAYWRMEYIEAPRLPEGANPFAELPKLDNDAEALIVHLPAHPIVTVATAHAFLGRSKQAVNEAIAALEEKGVLHPVTLARRNRAWEARDLFDLINAFERDLATPSDDEEPTRPAPRGRTSSSP